MPPPDTCVLQVGDTSTPTDSVNLNDHTSVILVGFDEGTIQEPPGPNPEETQYAYQGRRTLKLDLRVIDTSAGSFVNAEATIRAIEHKLTQAQRALGAGGQWIGTPVTLRMRWTSSSPYAYFDVAGGTVTQLWAAQGSKPGIHCTLTLQCLPYCHGDQVTTGVISIGSGFQYSQIITSVPGDRSAITTLYWGDISGTGHTNRIRAGRRSFPNMAFDAYTGVADLKPDGGTDTADATAANGHYVRLTATANPQKIASAGIPDKFTGVETGTFDGLTSALNGAGSGFNVSAAAKFVGSFGVETICGTTAGFYGTAYFTIPHVTQATYGESWINVRNTLSGISGAATYLTLASSALSVTGEGVVSLIYNPAASSWQLATRDLSGSYVQVNLSTQLVQNTWYKVRLVYDQLPSAQPRSSCYLSTDGRIWTLVAQHSDVTAGTMHVPDTFALQTFAIGTLNYQADAYYDQFQCGDYAPLRTQQHGKFDVWCRARTSTALLGVSGLSGTVSYAAGAVQVGQYAIVVTALDGSGNETAGSTPFAVGLGAVGEVILTWTDTGAPSNHRVYVFDQLTALGRWSWVATGSATSTYTLASALPLANSGSPPSANSTALGTSYLRGDVAVATPGGSPNYALGTPQPLLLGSSQWETVLLGTVDLPPVPRGEQNAASSNAFPDLPWTLTVQGFTATTGSPAIDVDAVWLLPHDEPQVTATYTGLNLATNYWWEIDTRRDGRVSGVLRQEGDLLPTGQVRVDGRFTLGVGNNVITVLIEQAGGVNSWTNPSASFYFTYRPRYVHIPDSVS